MKKIVLTASVIFAFTIRGFAQADLNLETWVAVALPGTTAQDPQGWASFNALNSTFAGSMAVTVFKETAGTIPAGLAAAKIVTEVIPSAVMIPNPFTPGQNFDTVGFLGIGTVIVGSPPSIKFGAPVPAGVTRPSTLSFSSMYTPVSGDSAFVLAYLTKWNGTSRDTIAEGQYATNATTTSYAVNSVTMMYDAAFSTVPAADTMIIIASSSVFRHSGAKKGSTFYVDNFAWSGYNNINELGNLGTVSVFPNPATNRVTITSSVSADVVEVTDIAGRKVGVYTMSANAASLETSGFAPGVYIYNVLNTKKQVINRGKFEVTK